MQYLKFKRGCAALLALALTACATGERGYAVSMTSIPHYGERIGIPQYYVNGAWGGNSYGWGGGGSDVCCAVLHYTNDGRLEATVRWETFRAEVGEDLWHEQKVYVNVDNSLGNSGRLYVHFLPGHKVELWLTMKGFRQADYPGPKSHVIPYVDGPDYVPLPGEKPYPKESASTKKRGYQ